ALLKRLIGICNEAILILLGKLSRGANDLVDEPSQIHRLVDFVGDDCDQGLQEGRCRMSVSVLVELSESKLRCAVNRDKQVKFAFFGAHFSDIDATASASSSALSTVERGTFGPIGAS